MKASESQTKNWLEWLVFILGLVLVFGVVGALIYEIATASPRQPPVIEVVLGTPKPHRNHFEVPITVFNRGDEPAEGLTVEVILAKGGEEEAAEFELQYLPRHSKRQGTVFFRSDPSGGELRARPVGYEKP